MRIKNKVEKMRNKQGNKTRELGEEHPLVKSVSSEIPEQNKFGF